MISPSSQLTEKTFPKSVCNSCTDHKCCRYGQYITKEEYNQIHDYYRGSSKHADIQKMVVSLKKPYNNYEYEIKASKGFCFFYNRDLKKCQLMLDSEHLPEHSRDKRPALCRLLPLSVNAGKININRSKEWCSQVGSDVPGNASEEYSYEIKYYLLNQPKPKIIEKPKLTIPLEPVNLIEDSPVTSIGTSIGEIVELLKGDLEQYTVKK